MTRPPFPQWAESAQDATFTDPADIAAKVSRFERTIRRRNLTEYVAGWFGVALSTGLGLFFAWAGEFAQAIAVGVLGLGFVAVMRNLRRRAANLERRPEEPCIAHLKRQYRHQAEALGSVATWYVGPLVPGFVAMQAAITWSFAQYRGWIYALQEALWPVTLIGLFFVGVMALNWWAARDLRRKLAALEELEQSPRLT